MSIVVERVHGSAIARHLPQVAALRIAVFREYPYLYAGSLAYEERYLARYASSPDSLIVLARDADRIVGAATAMPLTAHSDDVVPPFVAAGYDVARVYYFGESVLDSVHRGRGLGHRFLDEREAFARDRGYALIAFCAVDRPPDHPRRPADYRPLDELWTRHGFVRRPELFTTFAWRDRDETEETPKQMTFWTKSLA